VAGELVYSGTVEFGMSGATPRELAASLLVLAMSPFRGSRPANVVSRGSSGGWRWVEV